jgi:hypothetical protein
MGYGAPRAALPGVAQLDWFLTDRYNFTNAFKRRTFNNFGLPDVRTNA